MMQSASNKFWNVSPVYSINNATESVDALYQKGRYYQGQRRYEQALTAYRKALQADPTHIEARNGLAVTLAMQGKLDDAVKEFRAAIELAPNAAHLQNNLGHTLYLQGKYAAAVETLEHALILAPGNSGTQSNLKLAYAKTGNPGYTPPIQTARTEPVAAPSPQAVEPSPSPILQQASDTPHTPPVPEATAPTGRLAAVQVTANVYEIREAPLQTTPPAAGKEAAPAKSADKNKMRLEVSNGNGVTGFAKMVSRYLDKQGYPTARLTNQKPFQVKVTQIQYRPGFRDEALRLKASLPTDTTLVQSDTLRRDIQARLLLGKDVRTQVASFGAPVRTQLAHNTPKTGKTETTAK
jgi:hypothetical protein